MPELAYYMAFHQPREGAEQISFPAMAPIPVFLDSRPYLTKSDFLSASLSRDFEGKPAIRLALTPGAREKVNHIGNCNASAKSMNDYIGLLLHVDGQPMNSLTMVLNPLVGYEMAIRGLASHAIGTLASAVGGPSVL